MKWRAESQRARGVWRLVLVVLVTGALLWMTLRVWRTADSDVSEYAAYARAFWLARPRFEAFPREYPPAALLAFGLALVPASADSQVVFGAWMSGFFVLGYLGFRRFAAPGAAARYALYLLLGAQGTLLARFDLVPALATVAALWAAQRRRFALAYLLLGIGIMLKLYPLFLLPLLVIAHRRARIQAAVAASDEALVRGPARGKDLRDTQGRRQTLRSVRHTALLAATGIVFACAASITGAALLRGSGSALSAIHYAIERPIQIESLQATQLWLATFAGWPAQHSYAFGSDNYGGTLDSIVGAAAVATLILGCGLVYWRLGAGRLQLARAFLVCLCVVVLTSKAFSTQYLIWVLPFAAEAGGDIGLWLLVCALSFVDYPLFYPFNQPGFTITETTLFLALLAIRNLALVILTVRGIFTAPKDGPAEPASDVTRDACRASVPATARFLRPLGG